jgi:hypothetical protein
MTTTTVEIGAVASARSAARLHRAAWAALIAAILVAHLADLVTFSAAIGVMGLESEENPIARFIYRSSGLAGLAGFKALMLGTVFALMSTLPAGRVRVFLALAIFGLGLIGAASNLLTVSL